MSYTGTIATDSNEARLHGEPIRKRCFRPQVYALAGISLVGLRIQKSVFLFVERLEGLIEELMAAEKNVPVCNFFKNSLKDNAFTAVKRYATF